MFMFGQFNMYEYVTSLLDLEWLLSYLPLGMYYNITTVLTVLSCRKSSFEADEVNSPRYGNAEENEEKSKPEIGIFSSISSLFGFQESANDIGAYLKTQESIDLCGSLVNLYNNQTVDIEILIFGAFFCVVLGMLSLIWLIFKFYKLRSDSQMNNEEDDDEDIELKPGTKDKKFAGESNIGDTVDKNSETEKGKKAYGPLVIRIPKIKNQNIKNVQNQPSLDELFDGTIRQFLKELDRSLGMDLCTGSDGFEGNTSLPVSVSGDAVSSLTSPRLARRNLHRSRHSAQSLTGIASSQTQADETVSKYWIMYENFKKCMNWIFPDTNLDCVNFGQISKGNNNLASVLQYLHQNSPIRPRQWRAATCIVDYTLFILEHELKKESAEIGQCITFDRFESIGSASNGTLSGTADRFDVLLILSIPDCLEFNILHNNHCEDIPAGCVALGVRHNDISKLNTECFRKTSVQGLCNFYLVPKQVEKFVETFLKKFLAKLNRDHKSKVDRLPFKFQMSSNKQFVLTFDTRLVHGLGLGVGEISVTFIPALLLNVPQFSLLPPLYAVLPWRQNTSSSQGNASASTSVFGSLFRHQTQSDLHWNLCTSKLENSIIQAIDRKFCLSNVKGYHRECLMILKALFSQGNRNKLLNKGEIDTCVLETVVHFLLLESSPSAWTLDCLADRVSDAVHFLKSAYQNIWFPSFVVHNPHLAKQMPSLEVLSPLLSGRQQNMLADVSNYASLKVLDYIDQRLQETGLHKCIKSEFSYNMWEYEFFMFG